MASPSDLHSRFFDQLQSAPADAFLHHYTSLPVALEHILARQELRLRQFRNTNDPREFKDFKMRMVGPPLGLSVYRDVLDVAEAMLKDTWTLTCLTTDVPGIAGPVSTWERGWARSRMWAQYAENHRGVCLIFDRAAMVREVGDQLGAVGEVAFGAVAYQDSSTLDAFVIDGNRVDPADPLPAIIEQMWQFRDELFFTKSLDWRTEFEFRFLLRRDEVAPFPATVRDSLRGIVLGDSVSPAYRPSIDDLCGRLGIGAAQLVWTNGTPHLRSLAVL